MNKKTNELIIQALIEDGYDNDISTLNLISKDLISSGSIFVKSTGVVSGSDVIKEVFRQVNSKIRVNYLRKDGDFINRGDVIASVEGPARDILRGARVAINIFQRLCGIAGTTAKFVAELNGTDVDVICSRNTTPLFRELENQAVIDGGGRVLVSSLSDQAYISPSHIGAYGSITDAVANLRKILGRSIKIRIDVDNLYDFTEALSTSVDYIGLMNMENDKINECTKLNQRKKKIIYTGNIELRKARSIAMQGIDYLEIQNLTHSYKAVDINFRFYKKV